MIDPCFSATHAFCGACRSHAARTRRCWLPRWCRIGTTVRTHIGARRPGAADSAAPSDRTSRAQAAQMGTGCKPYTLLEQITEFERLATDLTRPRGAAWAGRHRREGQRPPPGGEGGPNRRRTTSRTTLSATRSRRRSSSRNWPSFTTCHDRRHTDRARTSRGYRLTPRARVDTFSRVAIMAFGQAAGRPRRTFPVFDARRAAPKRRSDSHGHRHPAVPDRLHRLRPGN